MLNGKMKKKCTLGSHKMNSHAQTSKWTVRWKKYMKFVETGKT